MTKHQTNRAQRTDHSFRATQQGNAMSETIVLSIVMIPLLFVMASLGKVIDLNQSTISASRYAAWERTVHTAEHKGGGAIATEVYNRFYVTPDLALRTQQGKLDGAAQANGLWAMGATDEDGNRKKLYDPQGENLFVSEHQGDLGTAGKPSEAIADVASELADIFKSVPGGRNDIRWDMEGNGLYIGQVGVNMNRTGFVSTDALAAAGLNLTTSDCSGAESEEVFQCLMRSNAILVDGWSAYSKQDIEDRARAFVPGSILYPVGKGLSYLGNIKLVEELEGLEEAFGHVETDALPLDRYELR